MKTAKPRKPSLEPQGKAAVLAGATAASYQADRDTWSVDSGLDLDGDELTVIVAFEDGVVVVTVY